MVSESRNANARAGCKKGPTLVLSGFIKERWREPVALPLLLDAPIP